MTEHAAQSAATTPDRPWTNQVRDLVRGLSGGFLFGIPLLYTMEVWWLGASMEPWRILVLLGLTFAVTWMLNRFTGFHEGSGASSTTADTCEAMALGIVAATATLLVLGELRSAVPFLTMVGKIVLESVPFSLGVAISSGLLRGTKEDPQGDDQQGDDADQQQGIHATVLDAGATIAGALFISFSIAPTQEVPMLAAQLGPLALLGLIAFSLVVSYAITFEAGFVDQQGRYEQQGIVQTPLAETLFSYLLSLAVAAILLWIFKQMDFTDPWNVWFERTIVLGLPTAIGGAAGRLAVGG